MVMHLVAPLCMSVCLQCSIPFESHDLVHFWYVLHRYVFRIFRSGLCIKVIKSRSWSQEQKACPCILFVGGLPLIERQSCLIYINRESDQLLHDTCLDNTALLCILCAIQWRSHMLLIYALHYSPVAYVYEFKLTVISLTKTLLRIRQRCVLSTALIFLSLHVCRNLGLWNIVSVSTLICAV